MTRPHLLYTVPFGTKSSKLNSRPVYWSQLYGSWIAIRLLNCLIDTCLQNKAIEKSYSRPTTSWKFFEERLDLRLKVWPPQEVVEVFFGKKKDKTHQRIQLKVPRVNLWQNSRTPKKHSWNFQKCWQISCKFLTLLKMYQCAVFYG